MGVLDVVLTVVCGSVACFVGAVVLNVLWQLVRRFHFDLITQRSS